MWATFSIFGDVGFLGSILSYAIVGSGLNIVIRNAVRDIILFLWVCGAAWTQACAQSVSWSRVAGPYAGEVQLVTIDRAGDIFATIFDGRVDLYRSTDRGATWQHVFSVLSYGYESALAVDSSDNIYYGDIDAGLFESTDGGSTWSRPGLPGGASAISVISGNRVCVGGRQTVSISSDAGRSWTTSTVTSDPVEVLSISEDSAGNIYAGLKAVPPSKVSPGYGGGVYISSDSGKTWGFYGLRLLSISSIAADKGSGKIFVALNYNVIYSAAQKSSNWKQDNSGIPYWVGSIDNLFTDPDGRARTVTNAGIFIYNLSSSGWNAVTPEISLDSITTAAYDAAGRSYAGTGTDGIYYLDNPTSTWVQCGIVPAWIKSLGMDNTGSLYAGTGTGIFRQDPDSGGWLRISDGLGKGTVYQIRWSDHNNVLYASTEDGLYYLPASSDYWIPLTRQWLFDFAETQTTFYGGSTGGIYMAENGLGAGWNYLPTIGLPLTSIYCLATDSSGNLYVGTKNAGVFVSSGDMMFWKEVGIYSPIIFGTVKVLAIDSGGGMFAGTDSSGAYYSRDSGETWEPILSISGKDVTCFLTGFNSRYFAGALDGGVYMSTDHGLTWQPQNTGLSDSNVTTLLLGRVGYVYAGTDSGLFKSDRIVTAIRENTPVASAFRLEQNFPNPFNPTTNIEFRIADAGFVSIKVYDVLGREVRTLVAKVERPGTYLVPFNAEGLPSGVYFYALVAGGRVETKKMVLMK